MTAEQFNALVRLIESIAAREAEYARSGSTEGYEASVIAATAAARDLLVEHP